MTCPLLTLKTLLDSVRQECYPFHSRVHRLPSFAYPAVNCFVKRDDELGFGISGSKIRKYRSLIPWLIHNGIKEAAIIGSACSNNVLGLCQLLVENGLKPTLFLRGSPSYSMKGNCLLSSLFVPSTSIFWIEKNEWQSVVNRALEYASKQPHPTFVLPEGASIAASLPGALTLPIDIIENENEEGLPFNHIFIEAGTGFMACALILGLSLLKSPSIVHVFLLADDDKGFLRTLENCHAMFLDLMGMHSPTPQNFVLHQPQVTKGFGQTDPSIFQFIKQMARTEGFLTDPIYSAKLFMEGKRLLAAEAVEGNILFVHTGGALSLTGFQEQIEKEMLR